MTQDNAIQEKIKHVSQPVDHGMIIEKNVQIPMRDGSYLMADIFRPDTKAQKFPAIMNTSVYQKDKVWTPPHDLEEEANPYMNWETVNLYGGFLEAMLVCVLTPEELANHRVCVSQALTKSRWIFTMRLNGLLNETGVRAI